MSVKNSGQRQACLQVDEGGLDFEGYPKKLTGTENEKKPKKGIIY